MEHSTSGLQWWAPSQTVLQAILLHRLQFYIHVKTISHSKDKPIKYTKISSKKPHKTSLKEKKKLSRNLYKVKIDIMKHISLHLQIIQKPNKFLNRDKNPRCIHTPWSKKERFFFLFFFFILGTLTIKNNIRYR